MPQSPPSIRILLGPSASQALSDAGSNVFAVIGRASWPEDPKRWILHLVPVDSIQTANAAVEVAQGLASVRRVKQPKTTAGRATDAAERPQGARRGWRYPPGKDSLWP